MNTTFKTLLVLGLGIYGSVASAAGYGIDYNRKDKLSSTQENIVIALSATDRATIFSKSIATEIRVEDEIVNGVSPNKHEGLVQVKGSMDFYKLNTKLPVTFYSSGALGYKSKTDNSFKYYVVAAGAKTSLGKASVDLARRLRTPFDEGAIGGGSKYRTTENSLTLGYAVSKSYSVSAKYAQERGDSNYNVVGLSLKHTF